MSNSKNVTGIVVEGGDTSKPQQDTSINRYNVCNLIAYAVNCFVTFAIGTFGLWDRPTNGDLSDKYQTIVTPFGTSFSIWGLIFIWQAFWVVWQFLPTQRNSPGVLIAWYYYPIMTIFQAGWTISFSYELMWVAAVCMYVILLTLITASMSLNRKYVPKTWKGYLLWQGPFSVQTGWIMAASVVMTNVLPVFYEAPTTTKIIVSSLSLVVLLITAFSWLWSCNVDFAIPLVIIWALGGVYAELQDPAPIILQEYTTKQINGVEGGILGALCVVSAGTIMRIVMILVSKCKVRKNNDTKQAHQEGEDSSEEAV